MDLFYFGAIGKADEKARDCMLMLETLLIVTFLISLIVPIQNAVIILKVGGYFVTVIMQLLQLAHVIILQRHSINLLDLCHSYPASLLSQASAVPQGNVVRAIAASYGKSLNSAPCRNQIIQISAPKLA
jgi:hypothetical protein